MIDVAGPEGELLPSAWYEVKLEVDGKADTFACGEVPEAAEYPEAAGWYCTGPEDTTDFAIEWRMFAPGSFTIAVDRFDDGNIVGPESVDVTIVAGEEVVADAHFEPRYETHAPGEECGTCDVAPKEMIEIAGPR